MSLVSFDALSLCTIADGTVDLQCSMTVAQSAAEIDHHTKTPKHHAKNTFHNKQESKPPEMQRTTRV
jgi:hypothetical protein